MASGPEYTAWRNMRRRCHLPSHPKFKDYGGRGISVAPEWEDFRVFLRDMGPRPGAGYSLERRDNARGYSKDNCYWATASEQNNNTRHNTLLEVDGTTLSISQWAARTGVKRTTIHDRLQRGFPPEDAISRRKFYAGPTPHRPL